MTQLPTGIGLVFPTATAKAGNLLLQIIEATTSIEPSAQRHDASTKRAMIGPLQVNKVIVNVSAHAILQAFGYPSACLALESNDAGAYALGAASAAETEGFSARVTDAADVEVGVPENFMFFVEIRDWTGKMALPLLLFPPNNPTPEQLRGMSPPGKWEGELPEL